MRQTLTLLNTAYTLDQLPVLERPQVAMAGRSNVGKSSLINCLAGRKALAKISSTPGKTRSVNFFLAEPSGLVLVDLPGYGFARRSKKEREYWGRLIEGYLSRPKGPAAAALLIDSRHEPQALDMNMAEFLSAGNIAIIPVFTKADKCKQIERAQRRREWKPLLPPDAAPVFFSAVTGLGREELWDRLTAFAPGAGSPFS